MTQGRSLLRKVLCDKMFTVWMAPDPLMPVVDKLIASGNIMFRLWAKKVTKFALETGWLRRATAALYFFCELPVAGPWAV